MKTPYISPKLNIICFTPIERLSADELNLDKDLLNLNTPFAMPRSAGDAVSPEDDDVFLPIG